MKLTTLRYVLMIMFLWLAVAVATGKGKDAISHISVFDGLPSNNISMTLQDDEGYIWIGTANGLSRYDGYDFLNFTSGTIYQTNGINAMLPDWASKLLWVTSGKGQTGCFDLQRQEFVDFTGCGKYNEIFWGLLPGKGYAWQYSDKLGARRICKTRKGFQMNVYQVENGLLPSNDVMDVKIDELGNSWLLTSGGVVKIDKNGKKCFQMKRNGILGICTYKGSCLLLTDRKVIFEIEPDGKQRILYKLPDSLSLHGKVKDGTLFDGKWIVLSNREVVVYDIQKQRTCTLEHNISIANGRIIGQNDSAVFFGNDSGVLYRYSKDGSIGSWRLIPSQIIQYTRKDHFHVATAADGLEYISTYGGGLFVYSPNDGLLQHYTKANGMIGDDFIVNVMADRSGNIWITNDHTGISCLTPTNLKFELIPLASGYPAPESNSVRAFVMAQGNMVSASDMRGNTYLVDVSSGHASPDANYSHNVYCMLADKQGRAWIGTRGGGLLLKGKGRIEDFPCTDVYDMMEAGNGCLWIATSDGLVIMHPEAERQKRYERYLRGVFMHDMEIDKDGNVWLATESGLFVMAALNPRCVNQYSKLRGSFLSNDVVCLRNSRHGMVAGTAGNGLAFCEWKGDKLTYNAIDTQNGLTSDNIKAIEEDKDGRIWVATEEGMSCVVINKGTTVRKFYFADDILGNCYNENASLTLPNGSMVFGTRNGMLFFNPGEMSLSTPKQHIAITELYVNGQPYHRSLTNGENIVLNYNENSLDIKFSDLMFTDAKSANYTYYMEGIDKKWSRTVNQNIVSYANLPSGRYIFHVKSVSGDNSSQQATLTILVRQPWWNSNAAWCIYIVVLLAGIATWFVVSGKLRRMKLRLQIEKRVTEVKLNFFTNIANELRTPLTLIYGTIEKLKADYNGIPKSTMQALHNGTLRLMRTTNQLSLFRELNLGQVHLHVERGDIVVFLRELCDEYNPIALSRGTRLVFTPFVQSFYMPFDHGKLELMLCGILSDVVGTASGSSNITFRLRLDNEGKKALLVIEYEANEEKVQKTMDIQAHNSESESYAVGIGLYISRQMAMVHHGELIQSRDESGRCSYVIRIPCTDEAYTLEERTQEKKEEASVRTIPSIVESEIHGLPFNGINILILEDDKDMASMMENYLSKFFCVRTADTGTIPAITDADVLIMDLDTSMKTNAEIYAEVRRIKADSQTGNTIIVLLTNGNDMASTLKSIASGADEVLSKPFSLQILLALITKQVKHRQKEKTVVQPSEIQESTNQPRPSARQPMQPAIITNDTDMRFKREFERRLIQGVMEPDFTVNTFAEQMHYSLTQFHKKVKEITGRTPFENIRSERMKYVARLLLDTRLSVDEIREKVGYSNSANFHNHFKQQFGYSPAQYRKAHSGTGTHL